MTSSFWAIACVAASAALSSAFDIGVQSCAPGTWAITFDDGPAQFTPSVLKDLSDAGVKATFFVIGSQLEDPTNVQYLQDAFAAGHQIASHSYTHANLTTLDEAALTKELKDTEDMIFSAIGQMPNYMRPPFGECGAECPSVVEKMGYTPAFWNIDSRDWTHAPSGENADQILEDIKRYLDGKGPVATPTDPEGVISLSHDIHGFSVERLPQILAYIKEQGFQFATVADCAADGRPAAYRDSADAPAATFNAPASDSAAAVSYDGSDPSYDAEPGAADVTDPSAGAVAADGSEYASYDSEAASYDSEAAAADPTTDGAYVPESAVPDSAPSVVASPATSAVPSTAPTFEASPTPADVTATDAALPTESATAASGDAAYDTPSPSPSATDAASPTPAASDATSAASSDGTTVGSVIGELQSAGVVSRPALIVSLVAPAAALLGFAKI